MNLKIKKAQLDDCIDAKYFYYDMIDSMQTLKCHPLWKKGVYPKDEYIFESVKNGELYFAELENKIIGAMIFNNHYNSGYTNINWQVSAKDDELMIIHALGVHADYMNRKVGTALVNEAIKIARKNAKKVIRLDVLGGNIPAEKLYLSLGFKYIETVNLYYDDTGLTDFMMYEYIL